MEITVEDLKYIFVRTYRDGKWQNINLQDATDLEFKDWIAHKLAGVGYTPNQIELKYSPVLQERVDAINKLKSLGYNVYVIRGEK